MMPVIRPWDARPAAEWPRRPSGGLHGGTLPHGGRERWYLLHVPAGAEPGRPIPLVLNIHGGGGNPAQQRNDSGMDAVAEREGFLVLYPAGTGPLPFRFLTFNAGLCCGYARDHGVDDTGFICRLLDEISRLFPVDPARVYAAGFSNGAFLCHLLAAERADRLSGIATVSGVIGFDPAGKQPSRPVPVIHFHGLLDGHVPYRGGVGERAAEKTARMSADETVRRWAAWNGCPPEPSEETRVGAAVRRRYGPGSGGSEVVLWTLENGGHTWPGGRSTLPEAMAGPVSRDIDASELAWKFFRS